MRELCEISVICIFCFNSFRFIIISYTISPTNPNLALILTLTMTLILTY